ncbi:hypothetical protein AB0L85_24030 [Streptomyces sp. NPDC052051]|uniref:hypothetical protein n=1 Tax=Streptomyces sp. NPDC052051 TaxID=3154649 RepID=UPI003427BEBD
MESELTALAASGATTLVALMVTDSWSHAREVVRRFFSRTGSGSAEIADLDAARARLLAAEAAGDTQARSQWYAYLRHLLQTDSATGDDLRDLLASLQNVARAESQRSAVTNTVSGGTQHGPLIQAGHISHLTLHTDPPADPA